MERGTSQDDRSVGLLTGITKKGGGILGTIDILLRGSNSPNPCC